VPCACLGVKPPGALIPRLHKINQFILGLKTPRI